MDIRQSALAIATSFSLLTSTAVFAEGGQYLPEDTCAENGLYIDGMLGYAQTNWKSTVGNVTSTDVSLNWSRGDGSFAGGADMGYQFNRFIGAEFGGFSWQQWTATGLIAGVSRAATGRTYAVYVAAKFTVPLFNFDNWDLYAKAGAGFQHFNISNSLTGLNTLIGSVNHIGPMFAVGIEYWITNHFYTHLQLTRFSGVDLDHVNAYSTGANAGKTITSPNLITVGLGYFFNL